MVMDARDGGNTTASVESMYAGKASADQSDKVLPAIAFAIIASIPDWPKVIDSIRSVELLTPGPVRPGTIFLEDRVIFGPESVQQMEVITLERPRRLRATSSSIPTCTTTSITWSIQFTAADAASCCYSAAGPTAGGETRFILS